MSVQIKKCEFMHASLTYPGRGIDKSTRSDSYNTYVSFLRTMLSHHKLARGVAQLFPALPGNPPWPEKEGVVRRLCARVPRTKVARCGVCDSFLLASQLFCLHAIILLAHILYYGSYCLHFSTTITSQSHQ